MRSKTVVGMRNIRCKTEKNATKKGQKRRKKYFDLRLHRLTGKTSNFFNASEHHKSMATYFSVTQHFRWPLLGTRKFHWQKKEQTNDALRMAHEHFTTETMLIAQHAFLSASSLSSIAIVCTRHFCSIALTFFPFSRIISVCLSFVGFQLLLSNFYSIRTMRLHVFAFVELWNTFLSQHRLQQNCIGLSPTKNFHELSREQHKWKLATSIRTWKAKKWHEKKWNSSRLESHCRNALTQRNNTAVKWFHFFGSMTTAAIGEKKNPTFSWIDDNFFFALKKNFTEKLYDKKDQQIEIHNCRLKICLFFVLCSRWTDSNRTEWRQNEMRVNDESVSAADKPQITIRSTNSLFVGVDRRRIN